ncbi:MAG TPA: YXWGXW repeat-containing protein, partial [Candidatus Acidoferrales bacterium]|nr:YXWGXW repeat-containing protein [Candidatus Acidoferrales bacterium]
MHMLRSIRSVRWLLLSTFFLFLPNMSFGQVVGVSITVAPPALPVYVQPICPADNYIWTPGYWAYSGDDSDYYFVPGTWVEAPTPGFLWTPGYWGWNNGGYGWNEGYWGPHVGFYGGVNYGFGYGGVGFEGGYWQGGSFFYNRSVSNINVTVIHNVYSKTVINNYNSTTRASFNGPGGVTRRPTAQEETFSHEQHTPAVASQTQHREAASKDRSQFAS